MKSPIEMAHSKGSNFNRCITIHQLIFSTMTKLDNEKKLTKKIAEKKSEITSFNI